MAGISSAALKNNYLNNNTNTIKVRNYNQKSLVMVADWNYTKQVLET